jgi:hypothetical protein
MIFHSARSPVPVCRVVGTATDGWPILRLQIVRCPSRVKCAHAAPVLNPVDLGHLEDQTPRDDQI